MAKLNNEQMADLFINGDNAKTLESISGQQARNFSKAKEGDESAPAYMRRFCTLFASVGQDTQKLEELENDKPLTAGRMEPPKPTTGNGSRFIITAAQNNTEVHKPFMANLVAYAQHIGARLICGQFVYNKNGFQNGTFADDDVYFVKEVRPYLSEESIELTPGLIFCGELNILPTALYPLSGFESYNGAASNIIPHSTIALESIATPKSEPAKMNYSTGCVTMHNYIQKKSGQLAQHRHNYGALIVEVDSLGQWFVRQIETDESGEFYDLQNFVSGGEVLKGTNGIASITFGDLHAEKSDDYVISASVDMAVRLSPENMIFHDTLDFTSRNHHNRESGHFLAEMQGQTVESDIRKAAHILGDFTRLGASCHVVESNHDDALGRWLDDGRYQFQKDPANALTYLRLQVAAYEAIEKGSEFNPLAWALKEFAEFCPSNLIFHRVDDSVIIGGVECGYHGHLGANGSRGNPKQFRRLARPMNTGHTHAASIYGGVYTAGVTGSLDMGYNKGLSSWSHSHIITYENGKRTIVTLKQTNKDWFWKG